MCPYSDRNPYPRSKAPLSRTYFSFFFSLSVSSLFFNIFIFSFFSSCVTEPLQPLRITDKANKNVPTNNLNRLALLKPSPFSRPLESSGHQVRYYFYPTYWLAFVVVYPYSSPSLSNLCQNLALGTSSWLSARHY